MDQFSFHGPFAYRWINDVPVERIDLRSGERLPIEMGCAGIPPAPPPHSPALPHHDGSVPGDGGGPASDALVRAAMAAWN
jgi:hypothetical protein